MIHKTGIGLYFLNSLLEGHIQCQDLKQCLYANEFPNLSISDIGPKLQIYVIVIFSLLDNSIFTVIFSLFDNSIWISDMTTFHPVTRLKNSETPLIPLCSKVYLSVTANANSSSFKIYLKSI